MFQLAVSDPHCEVMPFQFLFDNNLVVQFRCFSVRGAKKGEVELFDIFICMLALLFILIKHATEIVTSGGTILPS